MRLFCLVALALVLFACSESPRESLEGARQALAESQYADAIAAADAGLGGNADEVTRWGLELVKLEALAREGRGDETLVQIEKLARSKPEHVPASQYFATSGQLRAAGQGCILCSINCGLQVQVEDGHLVKIKGDKSNPRSRGYTCEKPARLDHYQNHADRLTSPLRRARTGASSRSAGTPRSTRSPAKLAAIRDTHGGEKIMYYGGGGQGNHLGGAYSAATRRALGMRYAVERSRPGEDGRVLGRGADVRRPARSPTSSTPRSRSSSARTPGTPTASSARASSCGRSPRIPKRSMIVIDPAPHRDRGPGRLLPPGAPRAPTRSCLAALLPCSSRRDSSIDRDFLAEHAGEGKALFDALAAVPIADYCERAGVDETLVREAARRIGGAASVAVVEDLGIEMAPHSTLNSYLEKLLYVLTGNFGRPGTMNLGTHLGKLIGAARTIRRSPVGGHRIITGPDPLQRHSRRDPDRPPGSLPRDAHRERQPGALAGRQPAHARGNRRPGARGRDRRCDDRDGTHADYILPGASQYEKVETTFFGGGFPNHVFQLRQPLFEPAQGTLPEPEIHSRLCRALGAYTDDDLVELREAAAESREKFGLVFMQTLGARPDLAAIAPVVLYETLGRSLGSGREPPRWSGAQRSSSPLRIQSRFGARGSWAKAQSSAMRSSMRSSPEPRASSSPAIRTRSASNGSRPGTAASSS